MDSEPMLTPREKSSLPEKNLLRGGSNSRRCVKQDNEPNTLPVELFGPPSLRYKCRLDMKQTRNSSRQTLTVTPKGQK